MITFNQLVKSFKVSESEQSLKRNQHVTFTKVSNIQITF
jgi:hypothetical protein